MDVSIDEAVVVNTATVEVVNEIAKANVTTDTTKVAEVSTNTFVLSTGGVYSGNINNGVPTWLTDAITAQVAAGTLNISQLVHDLHTLVQSIELGVNQSIASVQNEVLSQSQLLTTTKSQLQNDIAVAIEQYATIVTPELAKAVKTDALGVIKGQMDAWALDVTAAYATDNLASATQVDLLIANINDPITGVSATATRLQDGYATVGLNSDGLLIAGAGQLGLISARIGDTEVNISSLEQVTVGEFTEWDYSSTPLLGQFKYEGGVWYQYRGGTLGQNGDGWVVTPVSAALAAASIVSSELEAFASAANNSITNLQSQVDGSISTWFNNGSPEYSAADADFVSTDTAAYLIATDLVFDTVYEQMYVYTGANATVNLSTAVFEPSAVFDPVYKTIEPELTWNVIDTTFDVDALAADATYTGTSIIERIAHVGDLYYDKITGYGYRFAYEDIQDNPDEGAIFSWIRITDVDVVLALHNASLAQDTADGKRAIYTSSTPPTGTVAAPLGNGDMWIPSADYSTTHLSGEVYLYLSGATPSVWVTATRYTAQIEADRLELTTWKNETYGTFVTTIGSQVDKKAETFFQATVPVGRITATNVALNADLEKLLGDLWKNTVSGDIGGYLGNNTEYVYTKVANGANWDYKWVEMVVPDIVFDTIDTKKSIYTGNATPDPALPDKLEDRDMWITGSSPVDITIDPDEIYTYLGGIWYLSTKYSENLTTFADTINGEVDALQAQIDGKIEYYYLLSTDALPSVLWTTAEKNIHHGDALYFTDTKTAKRYTAVSDLWVAADDLTSVMELMNAAQYTADGKRSLITSDTVPTAGGYTYRGYSIDIQDGDIWIPSIGILTYIAGETYVYNSLSSEWNSIVKSPGNQWASNIEAGIAQISLSNDVYDDIGWGTNLSSLNTQVSTIDTTLTQTALDIATVDGRISTEEAARISAILAEQAARLVDVTLLVSTDASLDGLITAEETARINSAIQLEAEYKEYSRIISLAMADGVITPAEELVIAEALLAVNLAKARFTAMESATAVIELEINAIDTTLVQTALDIVAVDGRVTAEESSRISDILAEQTARVSDIAARVAAEAALDGLITAEEQARITATAQLEADYIEYSRVVTLALSDGVITPAEEALIAGALLNINDTKARLVGMESNITTLQSDVVAINTSAVQTALDLVNLDGAITAEEASRVSAILAEQTARASDIAARVAAEAALDGLITTEEAARIAATAQLKADYIEYNRVVTLALADGVLTTAEQALISAAATNINNTKLRISNIETDVSTLQADVAGISTVAVQTALDIANLDSSISTEEAARIAAILAEQNGRASDVSALVAADSALDGLITLEETARIAAVEAVEAAYKEYSRVVTLAMADGVLTVDEQNLITTAQLSVDAAKLRFTNLETGVTSVNSALAQELVDRAAAVNIVAGNLTAEEIARATVVLAEQNARIAAISQEVTDRTSAIGIASTQLTTDYKSYSEIVARAMADGVITPEEQILIASALTQVNITKTRLAAIESNATAIDSAVTAEANTRALAIAGITDVGGAIDQAKTDVTNAYQAYTDAYDTATVDGQISAAEAAAIATAQTNLNTATATLNATIQSNYNDLTNQIDKTIVTWFENGVPTLANLPTSAWTTTLLKDEHLGDLYYDNITGYAYRFKVTTGVYSWTQLSDSDIQAALTVASTAQSTADGKITTKAGTTSERITHQSTLGALDVGDLWVTTDESNALYRFNGTVFVNMRDTASDEALNTFITATYSQDLLDIGEQLDGVATSYFQEAEPYTAAVGVALNNGDTWFNTTVGVLDANLLKRFTYVNGTGTWTAVTNTSILNAFKAASKTKAAADRSIKNFTTTPIVPYYQGDTWMQGITGEIYVCQTDSVTAFNMDDWVRASSYTDDTAANRNKQVFRLPLATPPAGADEGDLWFVTNYYYTGVTGTASSTTKSKYGILAREYVNSVWVDIAVEDRGNYAGISWAGYASSLLTGPNGEITGWQYSDGGVIGGDSASEFKISADSFKVTGSEGTTANWNDSFSIVAGSPNLIKFNGVVTFSSISDSSTTIPTISSVTTAQSTANTANSTANTANSTANIANSTANIANTNANTAFNTAYTADSNANTAQSTANTANSTSNAALISTIYATGTTTIDGGKITTDSITAVQLNVANVQAGVVTATYVNALNITAAAVSAGWVYAGIINAGNITTGTLTADRIVSGSLTTLTAYTGTVAGGGSGSSVTLNTSNSGGTGITITASTTAGGTLIQILKDGVVVSGNAGNGNSPLSCAYGTGVSTSGYTVYMYSSLNNFSYSISVTKLKK